MSEHDIIQPTDAILTDAPLVAPICGTSAEAPLAPAIWSGNDIFTYLPDYSTLEYGISAIVEGAKGSLCIVNGQIDLLPVSDGCKEFLKQELPYIVKDITVLAVKGGWYTLTSSSAGEAVFEINPSSSAMKSIQEAIIKRVGGDYAAELFEQNIGGHLDPTVSAILYESVKVVVGSVMLGGANLPYAFASAIVNKAASYAYNSETTWDYLRYVNNQVWEYLGFPPAPNQDAEK